MSHDGASWLPAVLDGIKAQTAALDAVVAVDTGSKDGSPESIRDALESHVPLAVRRVPGSTGFPDAVADGLGALAEAGRTPDWIWILHDDANPAPTALQEPARRGRSAPGGRHPRPQACASGPRCGVFSSLGVTISGTGRRETGLERGEYDQGQHDEVREVLAVNTAGMLVRRTVLEEPGRSRPRAPHLRQRRGPGLAGRGRRPDHPDRPAGGGLPRRGGPPRRTTHPADRSSHPLPGAPGGAVHPARQRPRRGAAVPRRAAGARHRAADGRPALRACGRRGARRGCRAGRGAASPRPGARRTPDPQGRGRRAAGQPGTRPGTGTTPAGPVVAALPARPGPARRPGRRRDQPGRRRRRAAPCGRRRAGRRHRAARCPPPRRGRRLRRHRLGGPLPHQPLRRRHGPRGDRPAHRRARRLRRVQRRRALARARLGRRLVAPAHRVLAPDRLRLRGARAAVRPRPSRCSACRSARAP
ncbi:glycosyltransferase [Nocardioides sp. W3-2-3]|nr:glycosyltransferase [Nocardioides convexus]